MLHLSQELLQEIRGHGAESYPHECCGALLGRTGGGARKFVELLQPLINRRDDSPRNRFLVTAEDFRAAEKAARDKGLQIVGWYHSHPDHPARPSEFDREHAWPFYSYVILSVTGHQALELRGQPGEVASWTLREDRSQFDPETLVVVEASVSSR